MSAQYSCDESGNVTRIATSDSAGALDVQCFGYDYYARLAEAWTPSSGDCPAARSASALGGPAPYWQSWTFDPAGNRETLVDHTTTGDVTTYYDRESTSSAHALTSTTRGGITQVYGYDQVGNTVCRPSGTVANDCASGANSQVLGWSAQGQLESVTGSGGTSIYVYAADGSRLLADEPASVTLTLPGAEVKRTKATGTVTASRYFSWNGTVVAMKATGGLVTWLVGDHQGTHLVAVAAGTQAVSTRRQKPFGETRGTPVTWPNPKGFVGGDRDATGLVHIGARSYDPTIGSFISSDPVFDPGDARSWTGYAYAGQTPVTASDPTGLRFEAGDGGGSGSGVQTWIMNPMTCATLSCYQQLTQEIGQVQEKIETQRSDALLTGYNTCATQTCYKQYEDAVNSGQYDMVDLGGNMVTTDGSKLIIYTPETMMEAMAPPPPPEPQSEGCAWWKCAMNFVSDYVAPVLTVVALATAWIPVWGQVIGALAIIANVISAINSVWDAVVEIREYGFTWAAVGHLGSAALSLAGLGATAAVARAGGNFVKMFGNLKAVEKTIPRRPRGSYKLMDELGSARGSLADAAGVYGGWMAAEFTLDMASVTWSSAGAAWGGVKGLFGSS